MCNVTDKRDKPHAQTIRKEHICHVCDAVGTRIHLGKEPALPPQELRVFSFKMLYDIQLCGVWRLRWRVGVDSEGSPC